MHAAVPSAGPGSDHLLILVFTAGPLLIAGVYLWLSLFRRRPWPVGRTGAFLFGCALLGIAVSPPIMAFAHADLRGHMLQHVLLGMAAPVALVWAAPGTLLISCLRASDARRLIRLAESLPIRVLTHPATAAILSTGSLYLLYLTPLFAYARTQDALHFLVHLHFFLAGYLYVWSILGIDPAPGRPGMKLRLGVLFLATAAHAVLARIMFAHVHPRGTVTDFPEIREAALWMYYAGGAAELLLIFLFFARWFRNPSRLPAFLAPQSPDRV